MLTWLKHLLKPPVFEDDEKTRVAGLLNTILIGLFVIISLVVVSTLAAGDVLERDLLPVIISIAINILIVGLMVLMRRGQVRLVSILLSLILWGGVTLSINSPDAGIREPGAGGYILAVAIAGLLLGGWGAAIFAAMSTVALSLIYYAEATGRLIVHIDPVVLPGHLVTQLAMVALVAVVLYLARQSINQSLQQARYNEQAQKAANLKLQSAQALLEDQVEELTRAARSLEASTSVTRYVSTILDFDDLLKAVVEQLRETFSYYHVQIYLVDETKDYLVLSSGSGEVGRLMLERGDRIRMGNGLVGRAAELNQDILVPDVTVERSWQPASLLRQTKSEAAVPIALGDDILGVLNVHQDVINGLSDEDVRLLQSVANQVAVAMRNVRLFDELETALDEARAVQERYTEQSWQQVRLKYQDHKRSQYRRPGAAPVADEIRARASQLAWSHVKPSLIDLTRPDGIADSEQEPASVPEKASAQADGDVVRPGKQESIVAPLVLGDRTIGALQLHRAGTAASDITERGNQRWNDADLNFVQAVLDQVAQSAENLRLFEETQERAGRERVIREVTDRLRAAPNLDRLLEIATTEISHLFPVAHAELSLHVEGQPENGYDMTNGNPDHKVSEA